MPSRYRKKPLAQLEHGTRTYAPSSSEARYWVVVEVARRLARTQRPRSPNRGRGRNAGSAGHRRVAAVRHNQASWA